MTRWLPRWSIIGGLLALPALLVLGLGSLAHGLAPGWHRGDLQIYHRAAERVLQGQVPYRDFQLEYPPGALVAFLLPHLTALGQPVSMAAFIDRFLVQGAVLSVVTGATLAWLAARHLPGRPVARVLAVYALVVAVSAPLLPWRYDLFPAWLTLLALLGVLAGRPTLAGLALGAAVAAKLYPLALAPVLLAYYLVERRPWALARLILGGAVAVGAALAPFLTLDLPRWLATQGYYLARGLQIETVPGGALLLGSVLGLAPVRVVNRFATFQVESPLADALVRWQPALAGAAFGALLVSCALRFARDRAAHGQVRPVSLALACTLALLVFLATNKVFSAQHMIWLLPFAPLLPWRQVGLVLGAWALTTLLFPWNYPEFLHGRPGPVAILNLRNLLLLILLLWLLLAPLVAAVRRPIGWPRPLPPRRLPTREMP